MPVRVAVAVFAIVTSVAFVGGVSVGGMSVGAVSAAPGGTPLAQTVEPSGTEPAPPASPPPDSQPATPEDVDVPSVTEAAPGDIEPGFDDTGFDDTGFDDSNTDVSAWWWVAGIVMAVAAVFGVVIAIRRRDRTERWAQQASLLCDTARAMSVTLSNQLSDPAPWSMPIRYAEQQRRCVGYLTELTPSVPDANAGALVVGVASDLEHLHSVVTTVAVGERIEVAQSLLQPRLVQLAASLTALEELATALAMNAALPSSRAAN